MFALLFSLSALLLEGLAFGVLLTADDSSRSLVAFLLPHLAASALLALAGRALMPSLTARAPRASVALMFALSAFIPLLGFIGVATGLWIGRYRRAAHGPRGLRKRGTGHLVDQRHGRGGIRAGLLADRRVHGSMPLGAPRAAAKSVKGPC